MIVSNWRKALMPIVLSVVLLVTGCSSKEPSKYAQTQKDTTGRNAPAAIAKNAEAGSQFNQFFPQGANGYARVFSQEKKGFAEAKLNKGGKNVAVLSISDTSSLPAAAKKYEKSISKLNNYPLVDEPALKSTGVLVNNRFQVKVASRDPSFTAEDRQMWLQKFNLGGLSTLK
ncbi:hypothetical protein [Chamaesiphon sp. VAR_69_metabat_338]|uniref:hypothetical protein n=1 Tax=Chamaesiphon sp. VAR_69_metabat_338 TaxID=2964704 RepID=UPI00286D8E56|nr:hypothetical protein [Chamaesiphon sp. VAR_69_metabat_338]